MLPGISVYYLNIEDPKHQKNIEALQMALI